MRGRGFLVLIGLFPLASLALPAYGGEHRVVPSLSVKEECNDNILLAKDHAQSDFITTLSPALEWSRQGERSDSLLAARMDWIDYRDHRELNSADQNYSGRYRYRVTPRFGLSAAAGLTKESRPDRDIATTGGAFSQSPRQRIDASLAADWQFQEKTAATASYVFGGDFYEAGGDVDNRSHQLKVGMVHDWSRYWQGLKGNADLGFKRYSTGSSRNDDVSASAGLSRDLSELWNVHVDFGVRHTGSELLVNQQSRDNDAWGWVANTALSRRYEKGNMSLTFARDLMQASGLNGATESNALGLSAQHRFKEELSASFTAAYSANRSSAGEFSTQAIDQRTLRFTAGIQYQFSQDLSLDVLYEYASIRDDQADQEKNRQLFSILLSVKHPFLE